MAESIELSSGDPRSLLASIGGGIAGYHVSAKHKIFGAVVGSLVGCVIADRLILGRWVPPFWASIKSR